MQFADWTGIRRMQEKLGIDKVLMVCEKDNISSAKSIINNGEFLKMKLWLIVQQNKDFGLRLMNSNFSCRTFLFTVPTGLAGCSSKYGKNHFALFVHVFDSMNTRRNRVNISCSFWYFYAERKAVIQIAKIVSHKIKRHQQQEYIVHVYRPVYAFSPM